MATLYVETNLIVGIATGRDPGAVALIANRPANIELRIPGLCLFEALTWLEGERKRRSKFDMELKIHIDELQRDVVSRHAFSLRRNLIDAQLESQNLRLSIEHRLLQTIEQFTQVAEVLELSPEVARRSVRDFLIDELTDNLILLTTLDHAGRNLQVDKAFVSGNTRDFGGPEVRKALSGAGLEYFASIEQFLGWLESRAGR